VRGGVIISFFGLILLIHFLAGFSPRGAGLRTALLPLGLLLSVLTAVYTAYLFAQATARDLWQNPLLPPHLFVQALLAGSAALLLGTLWVESTRGSALAWTLGIVSLAHLLMVMSEVTFAHPTAHARLAMDEMLHGSFRPYFWTGVGFVAVGLLAPWLGGLAAIFVLIGLLAHEHAYVQAGQSVPLA
jgi:Ni/Fe-hydrogenase subunit HybB-like protein